jgi:1-acyl-sn-glycerol-3-phosphate acyltransferase
MKRFIFFVKAGIIVLITIPMAIITFLLLPFNYKGKIYHFMARIWSGLVLWIFNVKVEVVGKENINFGKNYIYISNHASAMDIPALICGIPDQIRFLAKQELGKIPLWGWLLKYGGYILIDRRNPKRAMRSVQRAIEKIKSGVSVLVFAEGTRSTDGKLLPFKRGGFMLAIKAKTPIVPVTIIGSHKIMQKHKLEINPGTIKILLDKPISVDEFDGREGEEKLMELTREVINRNLFEKQSEG